MTRAEAIKVLECLATDTTGELAGCQGEYAEFLVRVVDALDMAIAALKEQGNCCKKGNSSWISVSDKKPVEFVSVLGFMTDAGEFPPVRECYLVGGAFFFPALRDIHPVSYWMPLPEPPEEATE